MSTIYDDDQDNRGLYTAGGALAGGVAGHYAHKLANADKFKKAEEAQEARDNWKSNKKKRQEKALNKEANSILKDYDSVGEAIDGAEKQLNSEYNAKLLDVHNDLEEIKQQSISQGKHNEAEFKKFSDEALADFEKDFDLKGKKNTVQSEVFDAVGADKANNFRMMEAQQKSNSNLALSESINKTGSNIKNMPGDAGEWASRGTRNAGRNHQEQNIKSKTGVDIDLGRHTADNSAKSERVKMNHARSVAKVRGYEKPTVRPKPKVQHVAGGLRSVLAGLAIGGITGNIYAKATETPHMQPNFDPMAAQMMAGAPVVPPYGAPMPGGYAEMVAAQQATAQGQGQSL